MTANNHKPQPPGTRDPRPDKPLDDYFPSRFLKPADFLRWKITEATVTIARLHEEEVDPEATGQKEWKLVLYFQNKTGGVLEKGYLLSAKADRDALKTATGATTVGQLVGKRIRVHLDEWRRKTVLRIDPNPPGETNGQPGEPHN